MPRDRQALAQEPQRVNWGRLAKAALLVGGAVLALRKGTNGARMAQQTEEGVWRDLARGGAPGNLSIKLQEPELAVDLPALQSLHQSVMPPPPPQQSRTQTELRIAKFLEQFSLSVPDTAEVPQEVLPPPIDVRWLSLAPHPSVILILGKRSSGKSALGYRLLELFRNQAAPYVVGIPSTARKLLPEWIGYADRLEDVPPKAVILLDESYIKYHARDSMSDEGRTVGQLVNLSRQRQQSLIFIVQEARQLDVNAISQADVIAVKELSEISREFERRELKPFTDKASTVSFGVPYPKYRKIR